MPTYHVFRVGEDAADEESVLVHHPFSNLQSGLESFDHCHQFRLYEFIVVTEIISTYE